MLGMLLLGLAGLVSGMGYLYIYISRFLIQYMHIDIPIIIVIGIVILLTIPALRVFDLYAVIYFYFLVLTLLFDISTLLIHDSFYTFLARTGLLSVLCLIIIVIHGYYKMNHVIKTEYTIDSNNISLDILLLSDIHYSMNIHSEKLKNIVSKINNDSYDIVCLDGDIVDENTNREEMEECFQILSTINSQNIYYVYGNHDDNKYTKQPHFNHEDIRNVCIKNNIKVLEDDIDYYKNIAIIGRKDASLKRKTLEELLLQDTSDYRIVFDHQPLDMNHKDINLQLSGHTHGGQIWPTGYLQAIITKTMRYGLKTINDYHIITTSGLSGWGYPIKNGAPSEYVVIHIGEKQ